jgi:hypothetical protein
MPCILQIDHTMFTFQIAFIYNIVHACLAVINVDTVMQSFLIQ